MKLTTNDKIPYFTNGYAAIKLNGKFGAIDKTGKTVIPNEYSSLWIYTSPKNIIKVSKEVDRKTVYGLINTQHKILIPVEFPSLTVDSNLVVVYKNLKYGLQDITGKELLPLEYNSLTTFSKEKVARAEKGSQYGFIDLKGNWIFEKAKSVFTLYDCFNGMIRCKVNYKFGYLDMKGNEVIVTKYDNAEDFSQNGLARVAKSNAETKYKMLYGYINKKGDEVIPTIYETLSLFKNDLAYAKDPETNRFGYFDKTGKWAIKPIYLNISNHFDKYGGSWVKMTDDKLHYINRTGKDLGTIDSVGTSSRDFDTEYVISADLSYPYVLIDQKGAVVKTIEDCDGIYSFAENIAGFKSKKAGLFGFVDLNGNKIIEAAYTGFNGLSDGLIRVSQNINGKTKNGYIDTKGEKIIPLEYETATNFKNGWAVVKKDSSYYFIDKKGNRKEPARRYDALTEFKSGFSLGTVKNKTGLNSYYYIDATLKEVFSIQAKNAYPIWEDVAVINRDTTYELINKKGESVKVLTGINFLKFTNQGKLAVRQGKKWGFIDTKGNTVIALQYDSCDSFVGEYAKIMMDGKWGIIDHSGKIIIKPEYKNIIPGEDETFVILNSNWGVIDKTGKVIAEEKFNTITPFVKNRALARLGKSFTILKSPLRK